MTFEEISDRNRRGTCIRTGTASCDVEGCDEGCFRCMDPVAADDVLRDTLRREDLPHYGHTYDEITGDRG